MKHDPTFSAPIAPGGQRGVPGALTPRQARFVREYVDCLNASEAARRAGYSKRTACEQGNALLTKPHIRAAVEECVFARAQLTRAEIVTELRDVAMANAEDFFDWSMIEDVREVLDDGTVIVRQRADVQLKPSSQLSRRQKAVIKGVISKTRADGTTTVELSMHDKLAALDKLARIFDLFPRGEGEARVNVAIHAPVTSVSVTYCDDPADARTIDGEAREVGGDES
jgi:phage terminase small subunit